MKLYKNKYRIASARRAHWDYGWNAAYFVTICTKDRACFFGKVTDGKMRHSEIGEIVKQEWLKTPEIRPDMNLVLDEWMIMPNHFHAIICIGDNEYNSNDRNGPGEPGEPGRQGERDGIDDRDAMHRVSTFRLPGTGTDDYKNAFQPQSKNLSSIIRGFKSAVTKQARQIHADFGWQTRFHDHIIRDYDSHQRIKNYIIGNPKKWGVDKFNPNRNA